MLAIEILCILPSRLNDMEHTSFHTSMFHNPFGSFWCESYSFHRYKYFIFSFRNSNGANILA